jgi:hypothetical protein
MGGDYIEYYLRTTSSSGFIILAFKTYTTTLIILIAANSLEVNICPNADKASSSQVVYSTEK